MKEQNTSKSILYIFCLLLQNTICLPSDFFRTDDEFISRFLHARKCNIPDSFELMTSYFAFCQQNQFVFEKLNVYEDHLMLQALKDGLPGVLSERDRYLLILYQNSFI